MKKITFFLLGVLILFLSSFNIINEKSLPISANERNKTSLLKAKNSIQKASDEYNMVNFNVKTREKTFEYFNPDSYLQKPLGNWLNIQTKQENNTLLTEPYVVPNKAENVSPTYILGSDDRAKISNSKENPYKATAFIRSTYRNISNNEKQKIEDLQSRGTGFLEGPNLLVTAAHCVYKDVTTGEYEDNSFNPRFPDIIEVFAGANGTSDINQESNYAYYAEVKVINIQKEYYENTSTDFDWAALKLDRYLGNKVGYYGKIGDWYKEGEEVYSYGYPGDKNREMWETHGKLTGSSNYLYKYDFDTIGGQSGSPIFMKSENGNVYVCGIHTHGTSDNNGKPIINGGTRFNNFIFHYLNSFVTDDYNFLSVNIFRRTGSGWDLRVNNFSTESMYVEYNAKMCNFNDAKNWTNLKDIKQVFIYQQSHASVYIADNWFATSITLSYIRHNKRYIKYGDHLSTNLTMNLYENKIPL